MPDNLQNPREIVDSVKTINETLSLENPLAIVAEFKMAIDALESAKRLLDKQFNVITSRINEEFASGLNNINSQIERGIQSIEESKTNAIKEINRKMNDPIEITDLASRIKDALTRLGLS